ncbi:MAG: COX15/CtaA family protein, partial [Allosphingosinicella sp.]
WLAFVAAGAVVWLGLRAWLRGWRHEGAFAIGAVTAQILLGILTLLSGVQIDIAVAHQGMAAILLGAVVLAAHRLGQSEAGQVVAVGPSVRPDEVEPVAEQAQ